MARDLIQNRRGNFITLPALAQGEIGITLDTEQLFVGGINGNVEFVSNKRFNIDDVHYLVGENQKYKTIQSAVNQWNADGRPKCIIFIYNGEYNESIFIGSGSNISFIGESKENVIWRTKTGYYKDAPLHVQGGYIANITFIADITDNPTYVYVPLQNGDPFEDNIGAAYGLHLDFGTTQSVTTVENCVMISYVNAGLACGTKQGQTYQIIGCDIQSYTPFDFDAQAFSNGACVLKSDNGFGITEQNIRFFRNSCYSEHGKALVMLNQSQDNNCEFYPQFVNNMVESKNETNLVLFSSAFGLVFNNTSFGNNNSKLNFDSSATSDGYAIDVGDLNNVRTTMYFSTSSDLNVPVIGSIWLGEAIAYSDDFVVQYAWRFTDTSQLYKRYYKQGVWSTWERCVDTLTETRSFLNLDSAGYATATKTDANTAVTCGYYLCTTNTPTGAQSLIQTITANAFYGVQYGWILTTGVKYKRTLLNNVFSSWVLVTE